MTYGDTVTHQKAETTSISLPQKQAGELQNLVKQVAPHCLLPCFSLVPHDRVLPPALQTQGALQEEYNANSAARVQGAPGL